MISLSAMNPPHNGFVRLRHMYGPTTRILKPYNLHSLHALGYQTDWSVTDRLETVHLRVPPRRSVYRDLVENAVGTQVEDAEPVFWSHEWSMVARKVLNPYIPSPNVFRAAEVVFADERFGVSAGAAFRNLNCVGSFKGPYSPTLE